MKRILLISVLLLACFSASVQIPYKGWNGIIPLHSTNEDVEKLLGAPKNRPGNSTYETKTEIVTVAYSDGNCKENGASVWEISKGSALVLVVYPREFMDPKPFVARNGKYLKRLPDLEMKDRFTYLSKDNSILIQTMLDSNGKEDVIFVSYAAGESEAALRCDRIRHKQISKTAARSNTVAYLH